MLGVTRRENRLDPEAGADIKRPRHRPADGEIGKRDRRPVEARDVVRMDVVPFRQVRREHDVAVRDDSHRSSDLPTGFGDEIQCV